MSKEELTTLLLSNGGMLIGSSAMMLPNAADVDILIRKQDLDAIPELRWGKLFTKHVSDYGEHSILGMAALGVPNVDILVAESEKQFNEWEFATMAMTLARRYDDEDSLNNKDVRVRFFEMMRAAFRELLSSSSSSVNSNDDLPF